MKIVILTSRFPFPLEKGDKLRVYNVIKQLGESNEVFLISVNSGKILPEHFEILNSHCKKTYVLNLSKFDLAVNLSKALYNGLPFQVSIFYKKGFKKKIQNIIKEIKPDAVYCHLIRMSEYVKDSNGAPKTLDYMDAFSKGMERRAETSQFYFMKKLFKFELKRLLDYEKNIFERFEKKIIISEQDKNLIPHSDKEQIKVIPNGVDTEIFHPLEREKKYDLLFTGNMGYPPNIEAALFTVKKIFPKVCEKIPSVNLLIAGIDPPREISSMDCDKINVIPEFSHIREAFAASKIMLAPMLISIGLQNKILQAMAMKIPCVCSPLANNAVNAPAGSCILEAECPEEYAEKIQLLLNDKNFYNRIAENAYDFVLENYNWKTINKKLEETLI